MTEDEFLTALRAINAEENVGVNWSVAGRFLYHSNDPQTNTDIWVMPTDTRDGDGITLSFTTVARPFGPDPLPFIFEPWHITRSCGGGAPFAWRTARTPCRRN